MTNHLTSPRNRSRRSRVSRLAPVLAAGLLLLSGCAATPSTSSAGGTSSTAGASASTSGTAAEPAYVYAGSAADTAKATEAGTAQAALAGAPVELPRDKTIGLLLLSGQSASSVRVQVAVETIAEKLGYKTTSCDPDFDAQKLQACATSLLAQNPSLIISASQNPTQVASAVAEAKSKGIPWFGVLSGGAPADGFTDYGINGTDLATEIDAWMLDRMKQRGGGSGVLALTAPTVGVANLNQQVQLQKDLEASGGTGTLLTAHDLDLSNVAQDVLTTTTQTLQQTPDTGAVWTVCDFCVPLVSQAVTQVQGNDRKTLVVGTFSTPQSVQGIRDGSVDAIGEYPWEAAVWVAVDQALENWSRGAAVKSDFSVFSSYNVPLMQPYILDSSTAGTSGPAPILGTDFESYFSAKWKAEFGVS